VNACGAECAAWYASQGRTSKTTYPTSDGHATTAPVGSFPAGANRWGVLDLAGNVWEWTSTPYTKRYDIQATAADTARVLRGGGWVYGNPSILRAAIRDGDDPSNRYVILGFRCAR
jgi:formylglycine-generating enzyme required for sulfatase activity